jgi:hypothetical protein
VIGSEKVPTRKATRAIPYKTTVRKEEDFPVRKFIVVDISWGGNLKCQGLGFELGFEYMERIFQDLRNDHFCRVSASVNQKYLKATCDHGVRFCNDKECPDILGT